MISCTRWPLYGAMLAFNSCIYLACPIIYLNPACTIDNFFDPVHPRFNMPRVLPALQSLKAKSDKLGFTCEKNQGVYNFAFDIAYYIVIDRVNVGQILMDYGVPQDKLVFLMLEPPTVRQDNYKQTQHKAYSIIFTWKDDWIDSKKYFKFCYPFPWFYVATYKPFEERKLCTLIGTFHQSDYPNELYSKRLEITQFFESSDCDDFDLYGVWPSTTSKKCKGPIPSKTDVLQNYKFCICYENYADYGYITEKIFDCFYAGVVPVYWGANNIEDYIDPDCYIDRRNFVDDDELYAFLKHMTVQEYEQYIFNIIRYLSTDKAFLFSNDYFVDSILRVLVHDYDRLKLFDESTTQKIERCMAIQTKIITKVQAGR